MRHLLAAATLALGAAAAQAGSLPLRGCDRPPTTTATQQDRLLRFTAAIKAVLAASGSEAALIARSGTDLSRLDRRYSHASVALADGLDTPWAVRQLYYACEEGAPRLFDQGLAGFIYGSEDIDVGFVSVLLLPADAAATLAGATRDKAVALSLLHPQYSANAYAFGTRYQNCNQWVAELLAAAFGGMATREDAQAWLKREGYAPEPVRVPAWLMLAGHFVPWVHYDDHPAELLAANEMLTSLPDSLEAFALKRWPTARRIEFCHGPRGALSRDDGKPLAAGCVAQDGDKVTALN